MTQAHQDALEAEFDRQVETLLEKEYPQAADVAAAEFRRHVDPLRERLADVAAPANGGVPFVIVVKGDLVAGAEAIGRVERREQAAVSMLDADEIASFAPIERLQLPDSPAYLMADIDTGKDLLNVTPNDALKRIERRQRSPLTVNEGIALVTHHPEAVAKNGGFSLLGSRCDDRRVTALWISAGKPKLGWCWAGNPHTWLGSASCAERLGA